MHRESPTTIDINEDLIRNIEAAMKAALIYEKSTGGKRKLGITGEVGEVIVVHSLKEQLGLKLVADPRSQGFDAIDKNNKYVQIKTCRSESGEEPKLIGRMSRFSKHRFDYALLAFLGNDYKLRKVWKLSYHKLEPIINKEQTERSGPRLKTFIDAAGKPIFDETNMEKV
ncbi:MAG: hypothetical protein HZB30_01410 [Nitrospirae bacterium]|nr:hypothetical protein [Nitrospirota bacterium]